MKIGQKNASSRLFTCFHYIHIEKTAPAPGGHVFPPIMTMFELVRDIYKIGAKNVTSTVGHETHVLTKFHEDWTINVTFRVFTCFHYIHIEKTAPAPGGHVFSPIWTIFELVRDINETNVSTKFHDYWAKIVTSRVFTMNTSPPPGSHLHEDWASHVTSTVFELSRGINGTNVLTKFHEDGTINVASRVFARQNVDDARRATDKSSQ
ncbi:hypothetical protein DPMN_102039 [Dreissena polymorpha]|uniref:Uncharacterized protein n=1 Tax=Dreissena polymorpha TaxID=45954 RepID=A0A9D4R8U6_DREPO|nr:hypothetical protein DPMN_102039 [Dreissena polymorpha]